MKKSTLFFVFFGVALIAGVALWLIFAGGILEPAKQIAIPSQKSRSRTSPSPSITPSPTPGTSGQAKGGDPAMTYRRIDPTEVQRILGDGGNGVLLDVRTREEWDKERIPGSILVPLAAESEFGPAIRAAIPDKNRPIYLFCRSGRRSYDALIMMERMGYRHLYNMGGIIDWKGRVETGK